MTQKGKKAGLSTKDVKVGGLSKTIEPGTQVLKINDFKLQRFNFMEEDEGYFFILETETKPIPNFEGFLIDKDDESQGRYEGQIGSIKTNRFYYKDGTTKSGVEISRDMEILKQIKNICIATGNSKWFDDADGKYETIEDFVEAFSKAKPFKDKYLNFCVGGKEYEREGGFISYDLFLPKLQKGKVAFEAADAKVSKLLPFNQAEHVIAATTKAASTPVASEDLGEIPVSDGNNDLAGAPEFEL